MPNGSSALVTTTAPVDTSRMSRSHDLEPVPGRVLVGPPPPPAAAPDDVLPATRQRRTDGARRYILYDDDLDVGRVADSRLSVDADVVVERELWR